MFSTLTGLHCRINPKPTTNLHSWNSSQTTSIVSCKQPLFLVATACFGCKQPPFFSASFSHSFVSFCALFCFVSCSILWCFCSLFCSVFAYISPFVHSVSMCSVLNLIPRALLHLQVRCVPTYPLFCTALFRPSSTFIIIIIIINFLLFFCAVTSSTQPPAKQSTATVSIGLNYWKIK